MSTLAVLPPPAPGRFAAAGQPWKTQSPDQWEIYKNSNSSSSSSESEMPDSGSSSKSSSRGTKQTHQKSRRHHQASDDSSRTKSSDARAVVKQEKTSSATSTTTHRDSTDEGGGKHHDLSGQQQGPPNNASSSPKTSHNNINHTPSPSASPKSISPHTNRTSSSHSDVTPPHPPFTPPKTLSPACFSPVMGGFGALGPMGLFNGPPPPPQSVIPEGLRSLAGGTLPRNCSDLIRSMAAKYNNNNTSHAQSPTFNTQPLNGFHRPPITSVGFPHSQFQSTVPTDTTSVSSSLARDLEFKPQVIDPKRCIPTMTPTSGGILPPSSMAPHLLTQGAFAGLPPTSLMDLSSTQALINMVRNASTIHHNSLPKSITEEQQHQIHKQLLLHHQQQQEANLKRAVAVQEQKQETATQPQTYANETEERSSQKRAAESSSPLDLSSSMPSKVPRLDGIDARDARHLHLNNALNSEGRIKPSDAPITAFPDKKEPSSPQDNVLVSQNLKLGSLTKKSHLTWTVDDVYEFVKSIDICAEYAETFREQRIDGACLSLLSEAHLTDSLKMKLGPALKLRSFLHMRTHPSVLPSCHLLSPSNSCSHCTNNNNNNNNTNLNRNNSFHSECSESLASSTLHSPPGAVQHNKCFSPSLQKENGSAVENSRGMPSD